MALLAARRRSSSPPYLEPYLSVVRSEGPTFRALLWRSPHAQQTRFAALCSLADPAGRRVADLGCGRADLLDHLLSRDHAPAVYTGVEAIPELACSSRERLAALGHPAASILQADFAADPGLFNHLAAAGADLFLFSGSLNTFVQEQALAILSRAWQALQGRGRVALAFNFLNARHADSADPTGACHAFDPVDVLGWAFERTPRVAFRQDYLDGRDAAVALILG